MKNSEVTIRDVAKKAGVSIDTVSRALGRGKPKWPAALRRAHEIRQLAEQMNYRPNAAARAIRNSRTRQVGVLVRNNPRDRYIHLVAFETLLGINEGLEAEGYVLSIIRFDDVQFQNATGSRVFHEHMLDGMIVIGGMPEEAVNQLRELMPVCIWANTNVWAATQCIRRDEVHAGETIGQALLKAGYRRWALLGGVPASVPHYSHEDRFTGLSTIATEAGVSLERVRVPWNPAPGTGFPLELLDPSVAVIADGTPWAHWVLHLANGAGKIPGRDFGLACCDESGDINRDWPDLSRMSFDHYETGLLAARMMLQCLTEPDTPVPSHVFRDFWRPGRTAPGPQVSYKV